MTTQNSLCVLRGLCGQPPAEWLGNRSAHADIIPPPGLPSHNERDRMQAFVGTSGYAYKEWKGRFYSEKIAANKMLNYYGQQSDPSQASPDTSVVAE